MLKRRLITATVGMAALSLVVAQTSLPTVAKTHTAATRAAASTVLSPLKLFVRGSSTLYNPDGIVITKRFVFVVWQGQSDHLPGPSTIVKYDHDGNTLGSVALNGRCDGLRLNPYTNLIWATVNNDGMNGRPKRQPYLATIDPHTLAAKVYAFPAVQPHGGGYDDIAFVGGHAYLAASNPTLNGAGINDKPIAVEAELTTTGKVNITPIMYGNSVYFDENTGKFAHGNFTDPDSLAVDNNNDLVVIGDNDQEGVIIRNPGTSKQNALRYGFATQFDDVAWTTGTSGTLWIADTDQSVNAIYTVSATFKQGTVFEETGTGNPVASFIGIINGANALTPLLTQRDGVYDPTSLEFVAAGGPTDSI